MPQELTILLMQRHQVVLKLAPVDMNKHPDPAARRDERAGVLPQRGRISLQQPSGQGEEDDEPQEIRPDEGEDVDDERVLARDHGVRLHSVHVEWKDSLGLRTLLKGQGRTKILKAAYRRSASTRSISG